MGAEEGTNISGSSFVLPWTRSCPPHAVIYVPHQLRYMNEMSLPVLIKQQQLKVERYLSLGPALTGSSREAKCPPLGTFVLCLGKSTSADKLVAYPPGGPHIWMANSTLASLRLTRDDV